MNRDAILNKIKELSNKYNIDCRSSNAIEFITGSDLTITDFSNKFPWGKLTKDDKVDGSFIEEFLPLLPPIDWYNLSRVGKLSESFIEKHSDKLNWSMISQHQDLSEQFMEKHKNKLDWSKIVCGQVLSQDFILRNIDKFTSIHALFVFQKLPADFKDKYFNRST